MIDALRRFFARLAAVRTSKVLDQEFEAELTAHLDFATVENQQLGMSPEEARRQAVLRLGGVQQSREEHRETRALPFFDMVMQDLRYAARTLKRNPAFTVIAVLILGLGIGANVVVFNVVNGILLRPLPFKNPQQLVWVSTGNKNGGLSSQTFSADAFDEFRERNRSFQDVTGYFAFSTADNGRLRRNQELLPVTGISVVGNFFSMLGVQPVLGRLFRAEESRQHSHSAVLLSYAFWERQFAGNPSIVGKELEISGQQFTVAGVLPASFDFGSVFLPGQSVDYFNPVILDDMRDWGNTLAIIGRLKPGVSVGRAQADANMLAPELYWSVKVAASKGYTALVTPLRDYVSGRLRRSLIVLWCAVGFILLIVCVNLSNLLLARAGARTKEFAMRSALGAGRARLTIQLITESLVLAAGGAVIGLAFAYGATFYLAHQGSLALPLLSSIRVDGPALVWTVLIASAAAVLSGLAPGLRASAGNLQSSLKDMGHGLSAGRKHQFLRSSLVVAEVALVCMLLAGSGLLLRSFWRLLEVDLGFEPTRASAIQVDYDDGNDPNKRGTILREMLQRVSSIPGIEAAGISDNLPLGMNRSWGFSKKEPPGQKVKVQDAFVYIITPGYLKAMGMRLQSGRDISWQDGAKTQPVVVINEAAARLLWPHQNAVGRTAVIDGVDTQVIGVLSDVRESSLEQPADFQIYLPETQAGPMAGYLVVRSALPPTALGSTILKTLRALNPKQPSVEMIPLQRNVEHAVSPRRFFVVLVSAFAGFGLLLAALGIYGVISYSVTQQTQEIGIRMALGATGGRVQSDVLGHTVRLAAVGIVLGSIAALAVTRLISSLLFETAPTDPMSYFASVLLLACTALLAGFLPAVRASRVDPMIALRAS